MNVSPARRQLDAGALEQLISAAAAAPSIYNTQPWRYRLRPETATLEVRAVPERALRAIDPAGRALHVSIGASLFNLRIAARHLGWEPAVRLLADPAEPQLLATVRLSEGRGAAVGAGPDLFEAIWRRHSSRLPFTARAVPAGIVAEFTEAAHVEGAVFEVADEGEVWRVLGLTAEAEHRTLADPSRSQESRQWLLRAETSPYGIPAAALGPQDAFERIPVRDFTAERHAQRLPAAPFELHPLIAVLSTVHDSRVDWLRTGQALQHVLLLATVHQLRSSLLHQAMEWPDLRTALRDPRRGAGHVQLLIRLGYGPEGAPSPRGASELSIDRSQQPGSH
jgi:hypothetical protein